MRAQRIEVAPTADGRRVRLLVDDGANPALHTELTPGTAAQLAVGLLEVLRQLDERGRRG